MQFSYFGQVLGYKYPFFVFIDLDMLITFKLIKITCLYLFAAVCVIECSQCSFLKRIYQIVKDKFSYFHTNIVIYFIDIV